MQMLGLNWFYVAAWLRRCLRVRLYPHKLPRWVDDRVVVPAQGLTFFDNCVVVVLHLIILASVIAATILGFIGAVHLIYGR